jgi:hypothetical protein
MRKRLRKKTRLDKRVAWGIPIAVGRRHPDNFDDFLDACMPQAIAAHGPAFGGSGHNDRPTGVIEVGRAADPIEVRKDVETDVVGAQVDVY